VPTTHELHKPDETDEMDVALLIGSGPDAQARADEIGGLLTDAVDKQFTATAAMIKFYRKYLAECERLGVVPKKLMGVPCRDC
jgi:hypothetical protein